MTAFDQYSELDPAKLLKEIDDAIDGDVFDAFSVMSPERVRHQLAGNGIVVSNAAMLDPALFASEVQAAIAGGGNLPAPPSGFAYLLNADGSYLLNADGAYILAKV